MGVTNHLLSGTILQVPTISEAVLPTTRRVIEFCNLTVSIDSQSLRYKKVNRVLILGVISDPWIPKIKIEASLRQRIQVSKIKVLYLIRLFEGVVSLPYTGRIHTYCLHVGEDSSILGTERTCLLVRCLEKSDPITFSNKWWWWIPWDRIRKNHQQNKSKKSHQPDCQSPKFFSLLVNRDPPEIASLMLRPYENPLVSPLVPKIQPLVN